MKVLVLGCGPAGLLAAHAASSLAGAEVTILSNKKRSSLYGCQFLHAPIEGLGVELDSTWVTYDLIGTPQDYAQKVYAGNLPPGAQVSPEYLLGRRRVWDIRQAYDLLWSRYEPRIMDMDIFRAAVPDIFSYYDGMDLIVSSIPLKTICMEEYHLFQSQECWAVGEAPEINQDVPIRGSDDTVQCNGTQDTGYYRVSRVFGYSTVEWPGYRPKPPIEGVVKFRKPLATTCTCWLGIGREAGQNPAVLRVGRYGRWEKGVLAHHAYEDTARMLAKVAQ